MKLILLNNSEIQYLKTLLSMDSETMADIDDELFDIDFICLNSISRKLGYDQKRGKH